MSLVVLLLIARRFKVAAPAYSVSELAALIRVPGYTLIQTSEGELIVARDSDAWANAPPPRTYEVHA